MKRAVALPQRYDVVIQLTSGLVAGQLAMYSPLVCVCVCVWLSGSLAFSCSLSLLQGVLLCVHCPPASASGRLVSAAQVDRKAQRRQLPITALPPSRPACSRAWQRPCDADGLKSAAPCSSCEEVNGMRYRSVDRLFGNGLSHVRHTITSRPTASHHVARWGRLGQ